MKYAQVAFAGNYEVLYDFKTDLDLEIGNPVVCHTVRGYSVGTVANLLTSSKKATNWIVQKVDVDRHEYLEHLDRESEFELNEMLGL